MNLLTTTWVVCSVTYAATSGVLVQVSRPSESPAFLINTAAARVDSDFDGMPDDYEAMVGLLPFAHDGLADADGDGLTNVAEYNAASDPFSPDLSETSKASSALFVLDTHQVRIDTDSDGLPDAWELSHGLDPFRHDAAEDVDGDGRTNLQEYNAGSTPLVSDVSSFNSAVSGAFTVQTGVHPYSLTLDSDGDGMPDWWEQRYGCDPLSNDASADLDNDGVSNLNEFLSGRDPTRSETVTEAASSSAPFSISTATFIVDTDGDSIPDAWELLRGLDFSRNDASEDGDRDGRTNAEEYNAGTDPHVDDWRGPTVAASSTFIADTGGIRGSRTRDRDGDGIPDWWEVQYRLNLEADDAIADFDNDGLTNLQEFNGGSNPNERDGSPVIGYSRVFLVDTGGRYFDSDSDGLPDWWERLYFNQPRAADPTADTDGDGAANRAEFHVGSNPLDPTSSFRILQGHSVSTTNGTLTTVRWASFEGNTYSIWLRTEADGTSRKVAENIASTPPENATSIRSESTNAFFQIGAQR